jgi:hypothetical protein
MPLVQFFTILAGPPVEREDAILHADRAGKIEVVNYLVNTAPAATLMRILDVAAKNNRSALVAKVIEICLQKQIEINFSHVLATATTIETITQILNALPRSLDPHVLVNVAIDEKNLGAIRALINKYRAEFDLPILLDDAVRKDYYEFMLYLINEEHIDRDLNRVLRSAYRYNRQNMVQYLIEHHHAHIDLPAFERWKEFMAAAH